MKSTAVKSTHGRAMSEAWLAGYEEWAAGAEYRVRELVDCRHNADTGALEFKVRWEDQLKMNPDTGVMQRLNWSDPQWDKGCAMGGEDGCHSFVPTPAVAVTCLPLMPPTVHVGARQRPPPSIAWHSSGHCFQRGGSPRPTVRRPLLARAQQRAQQQQQRTQRAQQQQQLRLHLGGRRRGGSAPAATCQASPARNVRHAPTPAPSGDVVHVTRTPLRQTPRTRLHQLPHALSAGSSKRSSAVLSTEGR